MEIAKGNVNAEADPWEAIEAALSAFELDFVAESCGVTIIWRIDPVAISFAHCGIGSASLCLVVSWTIECGVGDTQERGKSAMQVIMLDTLDKMLLSPYNY